MRKLFRMLVKYIDKVLEHSNTKKEILEYIDDANLIALERIEMTESSLMYEINEIKERLRKLEKELTNK